ncbi:MAG: three-Cys-motif partner protein TcmP [Proteobacteria bacterium]|jgi:three-Cys-motif partner protein|nr:three-Cys-motif partner protein TcmP [Pseudomonadota bacterium]
MSRKPFQLDMHNDPCPGLPVERGPEDLGVGDWVPKIKHTLLAKYISAAYAAMNQWPERVLIDPFCGPGRIQVKGEGFTRDGGSVVAWRQALKSGTSYTRVFVGDLDPERASAAHRRLQTLGAPVTRFEGPASETIQEMIKQVPRGALCLAYIDPYNLSLLNFDMIRALAQLPKIDFAVHFSTMDLSRNVHMESDPERFRFDQVAPGWKNALTGVSKSNQRVEFFKYWMGLVRDLGFEFSREMPLVSNNSGHEIYRLAFFARHDLPRRLWGDVAKDGVQPSFDF